MRVKLTPHQQDFCGDVTSDYLALIGGFGSGKTHAFCIKTIILAGLNPGFEGAIAEPTNYLVRTRLVPAMTSALEELKIPYDYEKSDQIFRIHFEEGSTTVYCLSGENWERLVGYNLAFFGSDETDTSPHEVAKAMWQKAISRVRWGHTRQIYSTSTPEGFKFLYEFFVEQPKKHGKLNVITGQAPGFEGTYVREHRGEVTAEGIVKTSRAIHATTYENPLMDGGYIASMKASYSPEQWMVWALGQFGNLNSLRVYPGFDRELNHSDLDLSQMVRSEPIHVGMDFNVGKMAAVVHVIVNNLPVAVDELIGLRDTPTMIAELRRRYPTRPITVYPDATGRNRSVVGVETSHKLLRDAGFKVVTDLTNPRIGDRVNSMNAMFLNANKERRYKVNTLRCPNYTLCLEQQTWVNGEPDKSGDLDHPNDAGGYFIHKLWPLRGAPTLTQR